MVKTAKSLICYVATFAARVYGVFIKSKFVPRPDVDEAENIVLPSVVEEPIISMEKIEFNRLQNHLLISIKKKYHPNKEQVGQAL